VTKVGLAHGKPLIATEDNGHTPAAVTEGEPSITDEGVGDPDQLEPDKSPAPKPSAGANDGAPHGERH
jgi:hypothetical protein